MAELGRVAVLVALAAAAWAFAAGGWGATGHGDRARWRAEAGLTVAAVATSLAAAALFIGLLARDFRMEYVAQYTSRSLSVFYTLGAFWAGQAGSLLLWAWILAGSAFVAVRLYGRGEATAALMPWAETVLAGTLVFFLALVAFFSNPFATLPVAPADGQGLNPLLQNYGQWIHPLTLYLGFVAFSVPFAFAIAALATGRLDGGWTLSMRRWVLWSWVLLTAGILFGARWAYVELGWGGYWAWDPVENASLLPWLVATAYLHSAVMQEKRGAMKAWTISMLVATFALSIFGTFLTRSGVISSVHAFAGSSMGPMLIGFTLMVVLGSTALVVWRLPLLRRPPGPAASLVSRESSFMAGGMLLALMTGVVFAGTVWPIVMQATRGTKMSVGQGFYAALMAPLAVLMLTLAGVCPLLAWRHTSRHHAARAFAVPLGAGVMAFGVLLMVSRGSHLPLTGVLALSAFVLASVASEMWRGLHARRTVHGDGALRAVRNLFALTPRRYGGALVHLGVVLLISGIALNLSLKQETKASLAVGQSAPLGSYSVTLRSITQRQEGARQALVGTFALRHGGRDAGVVTSEQVTFDNQQTATVVGIRSTLLADVYIVMDGVDAQGTGASVEVFLEPAILWLWLGMAVVVIGGIVAAIPKHPVAPAGIPAIADAASDALVAAGVAAAAGAREPVSAGRASRGSIDRELERMVAERRREMASRGCPDCGGIVDPRDRFCRFCGRAQAGNGSGG